MKMGLFVCAAAAVFSVFLAPAVYAHSPGDIEITYDASREEVMAVITHHVANPRSHYIKELRLFHNGQEVMEETYMEQESATTQTAVLSLKGVKPGDTIDVEAACNRKGSMRTGITVE